MTDAIAELLAERDALRAQLEVANSAASAAQQTAKWQAVTNRELNRLTEERDALRAQVQRMQWRPIETAPKTGIDVLLWTPSGQLVGLTLDGRTWHASGVTASYDDSDVVLFEDPTHWMPLPDAPESSNG